MTNTSSIVQVLPGVHVSPETAYVVQDYPYGFRLRCKIRYWIESHPTRGSRIVSQTSNPKVAGEVWNKPKAGTYNRFGSAMYLDDKGHVQFSGLSEYSDCKEVLAWREAFASGLCARDFARVESWAAKKLAFDFAKSKGAIKWKDEAAPLPAELDWADAGVRELAANLNPGTVFA